MGARSQELGVVFPLDNPADRFIAPLVSLMCVGLGVWGLFLEGPALLRVGGVLAMSGFAWWCWRQMTPGIGKTLVLTERHLEIRDARGSEFVPWTSVARVVVPYAGRRLRIETRDGRDHELPLALIPQRAADLTNLVHTHLPPGVEVIAERRPPAGSRRYDAAMAVFGLPVGLLLLRLAWRGMQTANDPWAVALLLGGLAASGAGLLGLFGVLGSRREARLPATIPLRLPAASLYPHLQTLQAGGRVPRMRFAYPNEVRRFRLKTELSTSWALVGPLSALFVAGGLLAPGNVKLMVAAICALPGLILIGFMGVYARQMRQFAAGLGDVIDVDGTGLYVVRDGRRESATLIDLRPNPGFLNHRGLNRTRAAVRVGDETRWYDPANMVEVRG